MKTRKRHAIHSGIGDHDDLLVAKPTSEDVKEEFQYAARLRGKKKHDTMIYPEIPFEYGISYKGKTLETYNEKNYEFGVNAHPEKKIGYCIEETKELPFKRLWEAEACFEAEVEKHNMQYAFTYEGHTGKIDRRVAEYAVDWEGEYVVKNHGDIKELFTDNAGQYVGYKDGSTGWQVRGDHVADVRNRSFFSGVIAKDMYNWNAYEASFSFRPILNDGAGAFNNTMRYNWGSRQFYRAGKWDDDIVGLIFQAKDSRNFYMMLWEADERIWLSSRAGNNLDGINVFTDKEEFVTRSVVSPTTNGRPTHSQWVNYCNNSGWGTQHRRIYKVTNGVLSRVNVTDSGSGKGWIMNNMHRVRVVTAGRNVKIYARTSPTSREELVYDFNTDWGNGAFGMFNVSQSVEFHKIEVLERKIISGRVPETGWRTHSYSNYATNILNKTNWVRRSNSLLNQLPDGIRARDVTMRSIRPYLRNEENGRLYDKGGLTGDVSIFAVDYSTYKEWSGRIPEKGWFEYDGSGDHIVASNAQEFVRNYTNQQDLMLDTITGIVDNPEAGSLLMPTSMTEAITARSNNAPDAGEIHSECFIECGIVEVTPDHRDIETGIVVWNNIADVFKEQYDSFFNRPDFINKKATYRLLKPVKQEPPAPPIIEESETGDCVIEEEIPEPIEIPEIECLNDFDFDGKRLIMWGCEFPLEETSKCFEDTVVAYKGWMTFDPLSEFEPNKWTVYHLKPIESTIYEEYDEIRWAGRSQYDEAPVGTKVIIRTKEWYKAFFTADISNQGIVNSEENIITNIPPSPEHFWHPSAMDDTDVTKRMPDHFDKVHYLLDAWTNHSDVVMWFQSNPEHTTDTVSRQFENLAYEGRAGMPVLLTTDHSDQIVIHCKEDPQHIPWSSGKYIGYGKVNGKRPFWGEGSGRADMVNVPTDVVFFPSNLIQETLEGPFIDIYDHDHPDNPRVEYKLHSDNRLVDFYSNHTDAYIWYTDWYSKWVEANDVLEATMHEVLEVDNPIELDPMKPEVSDDYDPSDTIVERIEVSSNNPFVKVWIDEKGGSNQGLLGSYYRFPLTANIYKVKWQVTGDYKEWIQIYEIKDFMTKIEIPITHEEPKILSVTIDDIVISADSTNGWTLSNGALKLNGTAIQPGMLEIHYSTGTIDNIFPLEEKRGEHTEVYVNGILLESIDYSFHEQSLVIHKNQLQLHDWVHIQSFDLNDLYDPKKTNYMGEKKYAQLDFQEDQPTLETNPNVDDPYYEGSFCFNWGYNRPVGMEDMMTQSFQSMNMFLSEKINFRFNLDMEVVYPVGGPVDISNFTGEWQQWDQQTLFREGETIDTLTGNGPGNWHGPPEPGYPEVTNLRNQNSRSGWYNPAHVNLTDYDFSFKVQARSGDDDMYGAIFKFDPETQNFYSFEWDGYWGMNPPSGGITGLRGMAVYKNFCHNPEMAGLGDLTYNKVLLARKDISWIPHTSQINEVKISTVGGNIKVWTNGTLQFDITDHDDPFLKGAWGPVTQSQPNTYFWDFYLQTYRRITHRDDQTFRKPHTIEIDRPSALGDQPTTEVQIDQESVSEKFHAILQDHVNRNNLSMSDVRTIEYFIREDDSDYAVYFNEENNQIVTTNDPMSTLYSTVERQYPSVDDPNQVHIPDTEEPSIPLLDIPQEGNPNDGFTIMWNGYIFAPTTGVYKFRVTVNDGFRLWIDHKELINQWKVVGDPYYFPEYEASIHLEGNKWYPIRADYFDNVGQALIRLHWAPPGRPFQRIASAYLTPYLGYRLFAQVKKARPLPWHPLIHNGYYYHQDREHYLYADKIIHRKTPNAFHEILIEPRPQQGSAIIVRDNEGNNLRKVSFYDDDWNPTLENKEIFHGNGYAKYYLNYKGIDPATVDVRINGTALMNHDYLFHEEESAIEFMEECMPEDEIEVRYILQYSYYIDMNADVVDGFVNKDQARIKLHANYDLNKMKNMEIIYEQAMETPFYRAQEVILNPLLNHHHTGFLYITEDDKQEVKDVHVNLSDTTLSDSGLEKVLLTAKVLDEYNNPCPKKKVMIQRDGIQMTGEFITNESGEVYFYDQPTPNNQKMSVYRVEVEGIIKEVLLNYYVDHQPKRRFIELSANKLSILAGLDDATVVTVTLRDENWNRMGAGHELTVQIRDTHGKTSSKQMTTDDYGNASFEVLGKNEKHGNLFIKVSHSLGFEEIATQLYMKAIGG